MPPNSETTRCHAVYWRAADGAGTHVWKDGLTEAEAEAQIRWCEGAHPEATMVWVNRGQDSNAYRLRMKDQPHV